MGRNEYDLGGVWNVCVARSQENRDVVLRIYDETFRFTFFFCVFLFVITANCLRTCAMLDVQEAVALEMDIDEWW